MIFTFCFLLSLQLLLDMASPTTVLPPELTSRDFGSLNDGLSPLELLWGQPLFRRVEPYSFWTLEVNMRDSAYVNLNLSFSCKFFLL